MAREGPGHGEVDGKNLESGSGTVVNTSVGMQARASTSALSMRRSGSNGDEGACPEKMASTSLQDATLVPMEELLDRE